MRYRPWHNVRIVGDERHLVVIEQYLKALGVQLDDSTTTAMPIGLSVTSSWTIDEASLRVIGKIAFNYAARWFPDLVLHDEFDAFRRYVRYGITPPRPAVLFTTDHPMKLDRYLAGDS